MSHGFQHPIIGQEAICPDGLGRVIAFLDDFPHQWIQVQTYVQDRSCKWAPENVTLIPVKGYEASTEEIESLERLVAIFDEGAKPEVREVLDLNPSQLRKELLITKADLMLCLKVKELFSDSLRALEKENAKLEEKGRRGRAGNIQVYQYLAYNGGFTVERTLIWHCRVISVDGDVWNESSGWHGSPDKEHALRRADRWGKFTGWPIEDLGRYEAYDHKPRG